MVRPTPDDVLLPWYHILIIYVNFALLLFFGYLKDFLALFPWNRKQETRTPKGYAPLMKDWESFFTRRMYSRVCDCWNRPIASAPGPWIDVLKREGSNESQEFKLTGESLRCLNLASYNYLGFADPRGKHVTEVIESLKKYGVSTSSPALELGSTYLHKQLEEMIARFVGKEAALVFGMGYATNSTNIPALADRGDLIISDSMNHASLVMGCRASGAKVKVFKHNDTEDLERVVRESIIEGQPKTHRPWKKIVIVVEGIYSMEGEMCRLPEIVRIKKQYKCYLYVDEAHSIGALGRRGRGVCDFFGIDPKDVDILMGTFTKAFASVGGYIASSKEVIDHLRKTSLGGIYEVSMPPANVQQAISAMKIITGEDGTDLGARKLKALRENANFFRRGLIQRGFQVFGDMDSPVIPMTIYFPAKVPSFSRECLQRGLAVVVVGFPAVSLLSNRVRFCISAAHTKEDLEWALEEIDKIGTKLMMKYGTPPSITNEL
jgi:serine palmitoyltransferase